MTDNTHELDSAVHGLGSSRARGRSRGHGRGQLVEPAAIAALLEGEATLSVVAERIAVMSAHALHYTDNDLAGTLMVLERQGVAQAVLVRGPEGSDRVWSLTDSGRQSAGEVAEALRSRALLSLHLAEVLEGSGDGMLH